MKNSALITKMKSTDQNSALGKPKIGTWGFFVLIKANR